MKKVRLLLCLLFLMVASAVLTSRMALPHGSIQLKSETHFPEIMKLPTFNDTLLKYASIDLGEPKLEKEIEELLHGDFKHNSRHRSFLSSRRNNRFDLRARSARGLPVQHQSPEFHRIWLRFQRLLHDWSRNRRFQDDVMLDLMNNANLVLKRKYRSCAVVGNSGILLKSEFGGLIDDHEAVIRLNNARIGSFGKNVGKKTSISFVNSNILHSCARRETCFCHPYGLNVPIAMYICQPAHLLDYLVCNTKHKAPLIFTNPPFDILCARIAKYYSMKRFIFLSGKKFEDWGPVHDGMNFHYSSGMQAVMLAVGVCEKVSIFGFGKSGDAKHHYHTNQRAELGLHDYEAEYDLYRDLVSSPEVIPFISDKFKFPPVVIYH